MAEPVRAAVIEYRLQTDDDGDKKGIVRVRQLIIFDTVIFSRSINTDDPRRHWKAFPIADPTEIEVGDRFPIIRKWLEEVDRQFIDSGYELTFPPHLVEATPEEHTEVMKGTLPRNITLRCDRTREEAGLPEPLERTAS